MQVYYDGFVAVMTAAQQEATRLGAGAYGSEHVLLGLLAPDVPLSQDVAHRFPRWSVHAVRAAVEQAADDLTHQRRLGLERDVGQPRVACSTRTRRAAGAA